MLSNSLELDEEKYVVQQESPEEINAEANHVQTPSLGCGQDTVCAQVEGITPPSV